MAVEKATRRMTLRQLLTHTEKLSRDVLEHCRASLWVRLDEFRDLSRPVRRRSSYPTMVSVQNAMNKLQEVYDETVRMGEQLQEELQEIRERAKREQATRT
jgi:hypothetical protein